eukprot:GFUD01032809.1.p1 GENE.GFUD01032809.1~~GFUD01032809.1.p1  ORF type:complete len:253 (+),score=48.16 GFUD01032809.1:34-792(+)
MKSFLLLLVIATLSCGQQPPSQPPAGQRCSGRNFNGRRCCTPENPCGFGEGDCDGPLDGGSNDGHRGCEGNLVCGSNNCKKFGLYFHEKDDCCDDPSALPERPQPVLLPGALLEPPAGQRCRGRNYAPGRRCCTPEHPCGEGEGDCDGAGDGGVNDGDRGCKRGLVCGSNNCKKFGFYYHEKDDCCERPTGGFVSQPSNNKGSDWGPWSKWSDCSNVGIKTRTQNCIGNDCTLNNGRVGSVNTQERYCFKKK